MQIDTARDALTGKVVEAGDDADGQPMLIVHTSREALKSFSRSLLFEQVEICIQAKPEQPNHQTTTP